VPYGLEKIRLRATIQPQTFQNDINDKKLFIQSLMKASDAFIFLKKNDRIKMRDIKKLCKMNLDFESNFSSLKNLLLKQWSEQDCYLSVEPGSWVVINLKSNRKHKSSTKSNTEKEKTSEDNTSEEESFKMGIEFKIDKIVMPKSQPESDPTSSSIKCIPRNNINLSSELHATSVSRGCQKYAAFAQSFDANSNLIISFSVMDTQFDYQIAPFEGNVSMEVKTRTENSTQINLEIK
jgi:hypothetical protein